MEAMEPHIKVADNSWLLSVQMAIFLVGCIFLYGFMYWQSGGRESFYEPKEVKEARWNQVFDIGGPEVNLPGVSLASNPHRPAKVWSFPQLTNRRLRLCRGNPAERAGPEVR